MVRSLKLLLGFLLAGAAVWGSLTWLGHTFTSRDAKKSLDVTRVGLSGTQTGVVGNWPPTLGQIYPDLILTDQTGKTVQLSDFAGKVILLELAAVPCQGCQAFAGGRKLGGFAGIAVQPGVESIHDYARQYANVNLGFDDDVVFVQLLLYGKSMSSPTQQEVTDWARHFQMDRNQNEIVLRGEPSMLGKASYRMIPGFHLIDREFVLRSDASGHRPQHNLYRELLPQLGKLAR